MTREQARQRIRSIVDGWPPLSDEQRAKLTELLRPVPVSRREAA